MTLLAAVGALISAGAHFYLNTRLNAFSDGQLSAQAVDDVELIADVTLLVLAGLIFLAMVTLAWWLIAKRHVADFKPGKAGLVAFLAFVAGVALVAVSFAYGNETVTAAIAANSLTVLGLGLVMTACVTTVRSVERIELKEPA